MARENNRARSILVVGGVASSLRSFRGPLLAELSRRGCAIYCVAGNDDAVTKLWLEERGVGFEALQFSRTSLNPFLNLFALLKLCRILGKIKPDIILGYTLKPSVFAVVAGTIQRIRRRIALIEGLGYGFTRGPESRRRLVRAVLLLVFRFIMPMTQRVVVLHQDDYVFFTSFCKNGSPALFLLPGIGVDMQKFSAVPLPSFDSPTCVMISRLLRDKGVLDYVEAARLVRHRGLNIRFVLVGGEDLNPSGISRAQAESWSREGIIEYLGFVENVRNAIADAHVCVLPSYYREGFPVTIMEAASMGRPTITTNVPGCRDAVIDGKTGKIVDPEDPRALASAIVELFNDTPELIRLAEGARSHAAVCFSDGDRAAQLADILLANIK
jgi:glycosyltransferase involved in cell wall biosynthesis